jgi:hypothetical protein
VHTADYIADNGRDQDSPIQAGCKSQEANMTLKQFKTSVAQEIPPSSLSVPLAALWWDKKGDWAQAHSLVDSLETKDGMAVHAYLHRKEGQASNADYWYQRAGRDFFRPDLSDEWETLVTGLLTSAE